MSAGGGPGPGICAAGPGRRSRRRIPPAGPSVGLACRIASGARQVPRHTRAQAGPRVPLSRPAPPRPARDPLSQGPNAPGARETRMSRIRCLRAAQRRVQMQPMRQRRRGRDTPPPAQRQRRLPRSCRRAGRVIKTPGARPAASAASASPPPGRGRRPAGADLGPRLADRQGREGGPTGPGPGRTRTRGRGDGAARAGGCAAGPGPRRSGPEPPVRGLLGISAPAARVAGVNTPNRARGQAESEDMQAYV